CLDASIGRSNYSVAIGDRSRNCDIELIETGADHSGESHVRLDAAELDDGRLRQLGRLRRAAFGKRRSGETEPVSVKYNGFSGMGRRECVAGYRERRRSEIAVIGMLSRDVFRAAEQEESW